MILSNESDHSSCDWRLAAAYKYCTYKIDIHKFHIKQELFGVMIGRKLL